MPLQQVKRLTQLILETLYLEDTLVVVVVVVSLLVHFLHHPLPRRRPFPHLVHPPLPHLHRSRLNHLSLPPRLRQSLSEFAFVLLRLLPRPPLLRLMKKEFQ